jgi:predicted dehydrogenase
MSQPIRMGVVGTGAVALRGILPHLSQDDVQDRVTLHAVCDPFPGRAEAAAQQYGVPHAYTTLEELLANDEVDAVTIATPIGMHYEQGKAALQAGKHVHFNKTMTTTAAEATELIELAKSKGLKIVASPGEALRPHVQRIKELIGEGAIGTLCWATCGAAFSSYHEEEVFRKGDGVLSNIDPSWYFRKPGGGPLYDMTVYALHGLTSVLGPAKRVTAMSGARIKERTFQGKTVPTEADDNSLILLDFGDNLFVLAYGTAAGSANEGFSGTYYGTTGVISGAKLNGEPFDYPGKDLADTAPPGSGPQWILPHVSESHRDIEEQHVFEDIMQLVRWVREGTPTLSSAEHARHVIEIVEAAYIAAETGETQTLSTTF